MSRLDDLAHAMKIIPAEAVMEEHRCIYCLLPVKTFWDLNSGGLYSSPNYCLVGDGVAHGPCFDRAIEAHLGKSKP